MCPQLQLRHTQMLSGASRQLSAALSAPVLQQDSEMLVRSAG